MNEIILALEDLAGKSEDEIRKHIAEEYAPADDVADFRILIAYESVGNWGCDSSSFFLLEKNGELFENHGSHCSCYGFEDQWKPERTTLEYLQSDKFSLCCGGYDESEVSNRTAVSEYIRNL